MTRLAHLSDPHFGTERPEVVAALRRWIAQQAPDRVVLSGDVTQRARRSQFAAAREFVASLERPTLVLPGNHDVPLFNLVARAAWPFRGYREAFGHDLEPTHVDAHLMVIGVNTVRPRRHKDGEVSDLQVERVCAALARATPQQLRVVVTHQPVHVIREKDVSNLLIGHDAAVRAWSAAGADIVLGGHIHLPYVRPLSREGRRLPRELWAVQAGTATSTRLREGISNSVNLIHWNYVAERPTCDVEQWDFDEATHEFIATARTTMPLDRTS
ncbi:3',5'-cyclic AMP phosphodiesterase CpdA [Luteibacter sp. Sphag1AF]|uniref:metallophosphoesterase family protein n=1 Tax=Luteibacter sp. Sphag1AF TaxID=2587031 RepID=UPI00162236F0|nr:metallophosphoesterase [Luteibacter sp. Sphag1AF]MBB3227398.1 3',5'-cyclic AMP phosphodiesterase CpdA [Luteibacter sp. Sphag1AF]